jgi:hypothetical protein
MHHGVAVDIRVFGGGSYFRRRGSVLCIERLIGVTDLQGREKIFPATMSLL